MIKPSPITAYCAACENRVSGGREGAEHVQGADGRIYCGECGEAMKLLERANVPRGATTVGGEKAANGATGNKSSSDSRKAISSQRLRTVTRPTPKPKPGEPPKKS